MNIICYLNMFNCGGAERVMSVLASGLARRGHRVCVVTDYSAPNDFPLDSSVERVILDGPFQGTREQGRILRTLSRIAKLRRLCREKDADILISFVEDPNSRAILATRFLKTKNLISVRVDPRQLLQSRIKRAQIHLLYPMADGCVFQTEDARQVMPKKLRKQSRVIFNPVSDIFYNTPGQPVTEKRVVSCGRLTGQKRFDLLIAAFDKICDEFPDYKLEIYGTGRDKKKLQKRIDELGRQDRICLMGRSEDVPGAIKNAALFVLASDYEGLPNALMEAMALGLPVVATDCGGGGARALIDHGEDGLIVPCNDSNALAEAIRQSLSDPAAAKRRGEQAAEKAKDFSAEYVVAQWEDYIAKLADQSETRL